MAVNDDDRAIFCIFVNENESRLKNQKFIRFCFWLIKQKENEHRGR